MRIDAYTHFFPKKFFDRMMDIAQTSHQRDRVSLHVGGVILRHRAQAE